MKTLALAAFLALTASITSARSHLVKQEQMDDLLFMDKMFYDMYNGFVRGLYREHSAKVVSEQCFGPWIQTNLTHLNGVMEMMLIDL